MLNVVQVIQEEPRPRTFRALTLFSGGLDSQLAVCVLRDQGIGVEGIAFDSPFFNVETAHRAGSALDLPIHVVNFSSDIVSLLDHPKHGFGSCMNPCIDCHARMLQRAGERLDEFGCHFIATGEVLNERPMSQTRDSLATVARESGFGDLVVRPLSAGLLPETEPERRGWVERAKLLRLEGRGRKAQFELAARYGLRDVPTPAGGCLLTEPSFCRRLMDLRDHEGFNGERSMQLLRLGRHFRLDPGVKLIVGRNEDDNARLEGAAELYDLILHVEDVPGPTALLPITASDDHVRLAASVCARYSDLDEGARVTVRVRSARATRRLEVAAAPRKTVDAMRI